jgi:hypothetical protein
MDDPIVAAMVSDNDASSPGKDEDASDPKGTTLSDTLLSKEETLHEDNDSILGSRIERGGRSETSSSSSLAALVVGGHATQPCFCLLDGVMQMATANDSESSSEVFNERVTLPIVRLPAILGRTHKTQDPHVVGMGNVKALSRQQCRIDYWCNRTGRLEQKGDDSSSDSFAYVSNSFKDKISFINTKELDLNKEQSFYTLTNLGKNRLFVNRQKVEQNETTVLTDGASLRISCFLLYFLLPTKPLERTLQICMSSTIPSAAQPSKKRKTLDVSIEVQQEQEPVMKRGRGFAGMQADLDALSTDELRRQLTAAIEADVWERRHQLIGSTLSGRAIAAAAEDPDLIKLSENVGGLSRGEIIDWVAQSKDFAEWSKQMHGKLEVKSFQSSITKAMLKVGFTRTASTGRYIKWMMPSSASSGVTDETRDESAKANVEASKPGQPRLSTADDSDGEEKESLSGANGDDGGSMGNNVSREGKAGGDIDKETVESGRSHSQNDEMIESSEVGDKYSNVDKATSDGVRMQDAIADSDASNTKVE